MIFTLPISSSLKFGDIVWVKGLGAGGWTLGQNDGQRVNTTGLKAPGWNKWSAGGSPDQYWESLASWDQGQNLLAGASGAMYASQNGGTSWSAVSGVGTDFSNWTVAASSNGGLLVAADQGSGPGGGYVYTSNDGGATWNQQANGILQDDWVRPAVSSDGSHVLVGSSAGLYLSTNANTNIDAAWNKLSFTGGNSLGTTSLSSTGKYMLVPVFGGALWVSSDAGASWSNASIASGSGLPTVNQSWFVGAVSADGSHMAAAIGYGVSGQIWLSSDFGQTWTASTGAGVGDWRSLAMSADGKTLVAARYNGPIYTSVDAGATWLSRTAASSQIFVPSTLSPDGKHLAIALSGLVYTATYGSVASTTTGTAGSISGGPNDALQLQYLGSDLFGVLNSTGGFVIQ